MVGLIDKAERVTRSTFEKAGDFIVLLGGLPHELGGSYFLQTQHGLKEGCVPEVDLEAELKLQETLLAGINQRLITSAHDLSEGDYWSRCWRCSLLILPSVRKLNLMILDLHLAWMLCYLERARVEH